MSMADLIARLERGAQQKEQVMENALEYAVVLKKEGYVDDAKQTEQRASRHRQHAADLRAAAAAVRLVEECKDVIEMARQQFGSHAGEGQREEECEQLLASIAEWEGKYAKT